MKKLILALMLGICGQAQATIIDADTVLVGGFDWNGINWNATFEPGCTTANPCAEANIVPNNGSINYTNDDSIVISGSDGVSSTPTMLTQMTTSAAINNASGAFVDFTWNYATLNVPAIPAYDPFFFILDTSQLSGTQALPNSGDLLDLGGSPTQQNSASIFIPYNSIFGFAIKTLGNENNLAVVTITDFSLSLVPGQPNPVPVPPALLLFGTALAGLGFMRKKLTVKTAA
jgi:hypothetical protein